MAENRRISSAVVIERADDGSCAYGPDPACRRLPADKDDPLAAFEEWVGAIDEAAHADL